MTALYGSLAVAFNIVLALRIPALRKKHRVSIGTGESSELHNAVRIHANNTEYTPLFVVAMLLAELCNGSSMVLHVLGGTFVVGRVLHFVGMPPRPAPNVFRILGMTFTWIDILALAGWTLYLRMQR